MTPPNMLIWFYLSMVKLSLLVLEDVKGKVVIMV